MSTLKSTSTPPAERIEKTEAAPPPARSVRDSDQTDLTIMELEERIAPRLASNHNESILLDR